MPPPKRRDREESTTPQKRRGNSSTSPMRRKGNAPAPTVGLVLLPPLGGGAALSPSLLWGGGAFLLRFWVPYVLRK